MGKGQKTCENCGQTTGPRAYVCKKCNTPFIFKAKSKESKNTKIIHKVNWRELVKGDKIKVAGGPYFFNRGEFIPMGYRGKFIVEKIDDKGIIAWGLDKSAGIAHIYMGGDIQNQETGVWKTRHKLIKLKNRDENS
jgi:ribosomal protein L40E